MSLFRHGAPVASTCPLPAAGAATGKPRSRATCRPCLSLLRASAASPLKRLGPSAIDAPRFPRYAHKTPRAPAVSSKDAPRPGLASTGSSLLPPPPPRRPRRPATPPRHTPVIPPRVMSPAVPPPPCPHPRYVVTHRAIGGPRRTTRARHGMAFHGTVCGRAHSTRPDAPILRAVSSARGRRRPVHVPVHVPVRVPVHVPAVPVHVPVQVSCRSSARPCASPCAGPVHVPVPVPIYALSTSRYRPLPPPALPPSPPPTEPARLAIAAP